MGGNDGLNTVVPYTDSLYPVAAVAHRDPDGLGAPARREAGPEPGDDRPEVPLGRAAAWRSSTNVGYPNSSLSHFPSRDIWHTADPLLAQRRGWLGRWADDVAGGQRQSALLHGDLAVAAADAARRPRRASRRSCRWRATSSRPTERIPATGRTRSTRSSRRTAPSTRSRTRRRRLSGSRAGRHLLLGRPPDGGHRLRRRWGTTRTTASARGLQLIAQIINADVGARILYITYGGFDNHSGEDVDHDPLLTDVSDSIKAFFDDLDGHGKSHDVLLMTWSEFGRRAAGQRLQRHRPRHRGAALRRRRRGRPGHPRRARRTWRTSTPTET